MMCRAIMDFSVELSFFFVVSASHKEKELGLATELGDLRENQRGAD